LLKNGDFNKVSSIFIGHTRDEGTIFPKIKNYYRLTSDVLESSLEEENFDLVHIKENYPDWKKDPWKVATQLIGDLSVACPTYYFANKLASYNVNTRLYLFRAIPYSQRTSPYGCSHDIPLAYLFGTNQSKQFNYEFDGNDTVVEKAMLELWSTFTTNIINKGKKLEIGEMIWSGLNVKKQALIFDLPQNGGLQITNLSNSAHWSRCPIWDKKFEHRLEEANPSHHFYAEIPWIKENHMSYLDYFLNIYMGPLITKSEEYFKTSMIAMGIIGVVLGMNIPYLIDPIWSLITLLVKHW